MKFTKIKVLEVCEKIAPKYGFDPKLIYAVCLQEGAKDSKGDFAPDVARLEQGYYRKYVEKNNLATTSEVLLSASYGVMQMMGLSLKELGYFEWYFNSRPEETRKILGNHLSQFAIPNALDSYCVNLEWMIDWGCKWLSKKRKIAKGDTKRMLDYWNGDLSGKYSDEVWGKYLKL